MYTAAMAIQFLRQEQARAAAEKAATINAALLFAGSQK